MRILITILCVGVLMAPTLAHAGHKTAQTSSNSYHTAHMNVERDNGVIVYRAQPIAYAPGELEALIRRNDLSANNMKLRQKLTQKSRQLRDQKEQISVLEDRIEKLEKSQQRRSNRVVYTAGFGFNGFGFGRPIFTPRHPGPRGR